jgi:hypothetical protein
MSVTTGERWRWSKPSTKHGVRANLAPNKVRDKQTAPATGTLELLTLLYYSYSCTSSAFRCGVVVILPAIVVGRYQIMVSFLASCW